MTPGQARFSIKDLNGEIFSLTPSALITLFEIDISALALDKGVIDDIRIDNESQRVFRFHANNSLISNNIVWNGKTYIAAPIKAEGFEMNARGTLPTPKLTLVVSEEAIPLLSALKIQIEKIGDLVGAKVIRRRTLLKYLDAVNFANGTNSTADPNSEFPQDVYYVDRKATENKSVLEFDLASILDVEGIQLPARFVVANRCTWSYRGEGCLYESENNRVVSIHGVYPNSALPASAPPVANENDEVMKDLLPVGTSLVAKGKWARETAYTLGQYVYVEKQGVKYYFVAKTLVSANIPPPNGTYWIPDTCSKTMTGCRLRWGSDEFGNPAPGKVNGNPHNSCLPYGGFLATDKAK